MPTARITLAGSFINRNPDPEGSTKDQQFRNCYPEVAMNPITRNPRIFLNKRPGTTASADVDPSAQGNAGCVFWSGSATPRAVFGFLDGSTASTGVYDQNATQVGGDISATDVVFYLAETIISTTPNLTGIFKDIVSGNEGWFFPEGGAWTQVTDGDFPTDVEPPHCHMDGYWFVMGRDGNIHNSDLNSLANWTATSFIAAQSMPDRGVGVVRYKNFIVAFGDASMEFFVNAGNATGSPLARVSNMAQRIGCMRQTNNVGKTVYAIGDTIYWLGIVPDSGAVGVFRLNGSLAEKISTTSIDRLLADAGIAGIAGAFNAHGMTHIAFINGAVSSTSHCYCIDTNFWWVIDFGGDLDIVATIGNSLSNSYLTMTNAKIYRMNQSSPVWADASASYSMMVQTENMDFGTDKLKFYEKVRVVGDRQASSSIVSILFSDDDYGTFSTARNVDLSTAFNQVTRLGASRRRSWKLTHSATTPCRLEAIEIDYEAGQT